VRDQDPATGDLNEGNDAERGGLAMQNDGEACHNRFQRRLGGRAGSGVGAGFGRLGRRRDLNPSEPDLAAIIKDEAAAIQNFGDFPGVEGLETARGCCVRLHGRVRRGDIDRAEKASKTVRNTDVREH